MSVALIQWYLASFAYPAHRTASKAMLIATFNSNDFAVVDRI